MANKPGNLAAVVNDVGVLYLPGGARSVAALSINIPDDGCATKIIQLLGLIANGTTDLYLVVRCWFAVGSYLGES